MYIIFKQKQNYIIIFTILISKELNLHVQTKLFNINFVAKHHIHLVVILVNFGGPKNATPKATGSDKSFLAFPT
jgi:hypothetical protein